MESVEDKKKKGDGGDGGKDKSHTIVKKHHFRSSAPNARTVVNDFVDKAYAWYVNTLKEQADKGRYMYNPIPKSEGAPLIAAHCVHPSGAVSISLM